MDSPPSSLLNGRLSLTRKLGEGGMALVFEAYDHDLTVWRAVKFLHPHLTQQANVRRRFLGEARALAKLDHPHIVRVYDVGEEEGWPYLLMSLTRGGSLQSFLARHQRMGPHQAIQVMVEICEGIQAAHDAGIVHRDLKPDNVLITASGVCKVTDFGIAQVDHNTLKTRTGSTMGTLGYMAPEQLRDSKNLGPTADIYSLGATLFALLTGLQPADLHLAAMEPAILEEVPEILRPVVERATRFKPDERYPDVEALKEDLVSGLAQVAPDPSPPPLAVEVLPLEPPVREEPTDEAPRPKPSPSLRPEQLPYTMPTPGPPRPDPEAEDKARRKREALEQLKRIEERRRSAAPPPPRQPNAPHPPEHEGPGAGAPDGGLGADGPASTPAASRSAPRRLIAVVVSLAALGSALLVTVFFGLVLAGALKVRDAASDALDAREAFVTALEAEKPIVDDLRAMGIRDDAIAIAHLRVLSIRKPHERMQRGAELVTFMREEHSKAKGKTPPHLQEHAQSAEQRLDRLEQSLTRMQQTEETWQRTASKGLGALAVTVGAASGP